MSHFSKVKTQIKDKSILISALKELEYTVKENTMIKGYQGKTLKGDVVVKTGGAYDVGFVNENDNFNMIADWWGLRKIIGIGEKAFLNKVQKEYTVQKVLKEAKRKGYRVQSRKIEETGEVKLVIVRRTYG